jgi:hypothetical protein
MPWYCALIEWAFTSYCKSKTTATPVSVVKSLNAKSMTPIGI